MRCVIPPVLLVLAVGCNQPPDGLVVAINPDAPTTSDPLVVELTQAATDPNGHDITYQYAWTVDDQPSEVDADTVPAELTAAGQVWKVSVTPSDSRDFGPAATAEVTIANSPPTVEVSITPEDPRQGDALTASVEKFDADGEFVDVKYAWTVDGTAVNNRTDRVAASETVRGQVWEVVVTPSDAEGSGEPSSASVTIGNSGPSVVSAAVAPARPSRADTATCVGTGFEDPDGDPEGYEVSWSVDGTEVSTDTALPLAPYAKGSKLACTLTPFDGTDRGDPVTSPAVTLVNAPPSLASVTIGPAAPRTGTTITATLDGVTDLDGDAVTLRYSWTVDGAERSIGETLPGNRFVRGQRIQVAVTPTDGTSVGEPVLSNVLTAANTPPIVASVTLDPADPDTETDVVATVTASDPDGDAYTLTYAWSVDGTVVAASGDTLAGDTWFDKHDSISVAVTATDTESGMALTSDTIYAINTPPAGPELSFSPAEPTAEEDVQCAIDAQDPDLDDDSISYTFAWTRNGSSFSGASTTTHTGDTIDAGDRSEGDEWVCTVTPHDGEDNGPDVSIVLGAPAPTGVSGGGTLHDTTLAGGSMPGTVYDDACPSGQFVVGISGDLTSSSGYFAELAPRCAPMSLSCGTRTCTVTTGSITTGTYRGGSGSYLHTEDCPSGEVASGFIGRAGWDMDQLTLRCRPLEVTFDGADWTVDVGSTYSDLPSIGGTGGGAFSRVDCVTGEVATRATIRAASSQVDGFRLGCQVPELSFD